MEGDDAMTNEEARLISEDYESSRTLRELYFELGRALSGHERYQEAAIMFQKSLGEQGILPDKCEVLFYMARSQDRAGDRQQAFRTYLEVIVAAPEQSKVVLPFMHNLLTRNSVESEKKWLQGVWMQEIARVALAEIDRANIAFFLGRVNIYLGEYIQALAFFEQAMQILSYDVRVVEGYGETLWKTGKLEEAVKVLEQAREMALQGKHRERLVAITIKLAQVEIALDQYTNALSLVTDMSVNDEHLNYELLLIRSECYLAQSQPERALELLEILIKKNATDVRAYLLQAPSLIALRRYKEAVSSVDQALQYDPYNLQIALYKSQALIEGQIDLEQARQLLEFYIEQLGIEEAGRQIQLTLFTRGSKDGNAHYFFAQFYCIAGHLAEALREVNHALEIGLVSDKNYPDAPAMQLKAQILKDTGAREDAATTYYEAGRYFYWQDDYETAVEQFERAIELRPDFAAAYWYCADALFMRSYIPEPPYVHKDYIKSSLEVWKKAITIGPLDPDYVWVYLSRARINDQLTRLSESIRRTFLPEATRWSLLWEAIIYIERAILLGKQDDDTWAFLSQFHRTLSNEANALHITGKIIDSGSEDLLVLEVRTAILADVGDLVEAEKVINKYIEKIKNSYGKYLKAYIILHDKRYEEARNLLDSVLEVDPNDLWTRSLRAFCHLLLNNPEQAAKDYLWIWSKYSPDDSNLAEVYGVAAYHLDKIDEAIKIFEKMANDPVIEPSATLMDLGLCYLAQRNLEQGEDLFRKGIERIINMRQLNSVYWDLEEVEKRSLNWSSIDQHLLQDVLGRLKMVIAKQKKKIERRPSPEQELKRVIKKHPRNDKRGSWAWVAGLAGLGRIYKEEKRWVEAAKTYQLLMKEGDLFPEARIELEQIIDDLQKDGDDYSIAGHYDKALESFSHALTIVLESLLEDKLRQANLYSRLGFVYFNLADFDNTRLYFIKAIELYREDNTPDHSNALGKIYRSLLRDATQYWSLEDHWGLLLDDATMDENFRDNLRTVRKSLDGYLDELFQLSSQFQTTSSLLPVVLEIGEGLIPDDTSDAWDLFKVYIPEMRQRFQDEMGVEVPGIRVRGNDTLLPHRYNILLYENPLIINGSVVLNRRYCSTSPDVLESLDIPGSTLIEAPHPLTGLPGCWISPDHYEIVLSHKLELWAEPLVYIIYHLEAILRRNLADFLGIQEVEQLVNVWEQDENARSLITSILPDQRARFYLSRVLRALIQEHVPIKAWKDILEALQTSAFAKGNISESVRAVRLRLRQWLPGNSLTTLRLDLQPFWEDRIASGLAHINDKVYFTAPPLETLEFLSMIRDRVHFDGWNDVLVTKNAELRPFIRLLVEAEFPNLMVLSLQETLTSEELLHLNLGGIK